MEENNVVFQVKKTGIVMNTQWSVIVDNKCVGKIDFKNDLKINLPKGKHTVQYKVGFQKTKVLDINVENEDIIVECIYDGTVNNFHIVGDNQDIKSEKVETNNDHNMNNNNVQNVSKGKMISLISLVIFIIIGIVISFSGNDSNNNRIDNKVTNKNVELSNTSFTGMRFKKEWKELKSEIDDFNTKSEKHKLLPAYWEDDTNTYGKDFTSHTIIFQKIRKSTTIQEKQLGINGLPYEACCIEFVTENSSDKIISIAYIFLGTENFDYILDDFKTYLSFIDPMLVNIFEESNKQGDMIKYSKDNIYVCPGKISDTSYFILICPASSEEIKYREENGQWRLLQNNSTTNNTNNSSQDNSSSYDENITDTNEDKSFNNHSTNNFQTSNSGNSNYEQNRGSNNYTSNSSSNGNNDYYGNDNNGSNGNDNYNNQPQQPQEKNIEMPNVVGMSVSQAEQKLNSLGIPYNVSSITSLSKDNVFFQSVPSGTSKPKSQFGTVTLKAYRKVSQVSAYINISSSNYNGQTIKVVVNGKECKDMMGDTTFNGKYSVMTFVNTPNVSVEVYIDNSLVKSQSINVDQISEKNGNSSNEVSTTINI